MESNPGDNLQNSEAPIRRFLGVSEEEEKLMLEGARAMFQSGESLPFEREKTERESAIAGDVLRALPGFLKKHGVEALDFTLDHVHIGETSALSEDEKKKYENSGGFYMSFKQSLVVFPTENDLILVDRVVHELLHGNSFTSITRYSGEKYGMRRVGLAVGDGHGNSWFHFLNEALTEELAKRFAQECMALLPSVREAFTKREDFIAKYAPENSDEICSVSTRQKPDGSWETKIDSYAYGPERKAFKNLIHELFEKNRDRFESSEEVFQLFVTAAFTGRLLEVGRLIEDTLGPGSFRELGEKSSLNK